MIAAIYIYQNSYPYLFGEGHDEITINFGGEYLYKLHYEENTAVEIVSKEKNPSFINPIIKKTVSDSLDQFTCIVGNNGAGKSTLLKDLLVDYRFLFILEIEGETKLIDLQPEPFEAAPPFPYIRLYYSPELNFETLDSLGTNAVDISRSSQFFIDNHGDSDHLEDFVRRHKSANIKRWIKFNDFYISSNIGIIDFPFFEEMKVELTHFRSNNYGQKYHNTPNQFRSALTLMFKKLKNGPSEIFENLDQREIEITDRLDSFHKFKFDFYETLLGRIIEGFESMTNRFLEEGAVLDNIEDYIETNSFDDALIYFLNTTYVFEGKNKYNFKKLANVTVRLLEFVHNEVDKNKVTEDNWRAFNLDYRKTKELVELYEDFNESFLHFPFKYYDEPLFKFVEPINLSNGEQSVLNLFSTLYDFKYCLDSGIPYDSHYSFEKLRKSGNGILLLLDEGDSGFHPEWKKKYIELLRTLVPIIFDGYHVQIIITTHDAITLSDFPRNNIVFLKKGVDKTMMLSSSDKKSFAANVSDLLEDSFFLENGLIGDWSNKVITKFIDILKRNDFQTYNIDEEDIKMFLSSIDEPIIKFKLAEMYSNISKNKNVELQLIEEEIKTLESRRKELE